MLTAHELGGGEIHRIQARRAEAADLNAGDGFTETRLQRREARDVRTGLPHRIDHAEDDVINVFFQAEDGIRDDLVTGVQTCALPILRKARDCNLQREKCFTWNTLVECLIMRSKKTIYHLPS